MGGCPEAIWWLVTGGWRLGAGGWGLGAQSRSHQPLVLLRPQADIDRRGFAASHVHAGHVGPVARFANLNRVLTLGQIDDESILPLRSAPYLAVYPNLGSARLYANRDRPVVRRLRAAWRRLCRLRRGRLLPWGPPAARRPLRRQKDRLARRDPHRRGGARVWGARGGGGLGGGGRGFGPA